ncbi:MAG TPA: serine protease [Polyangia bacterium]|jgi:V8-like Glu-specific endopeptidase|nr:serine protease [Polyangia bacterium]
MLIRLCLRELARIVALCVAAGGCSSGSANLPHFEDIHAASSEIQTAARAVVRVRTAGEYGSGFFISATGLLLTNNHVLGSPVCAAEGCYVELTQMHERGQPRQQPTTVFAIPTTVNAGLDVAVVQFYDQPNGNQLDTPDYLSFDSHDPASLLNQHITIVGHPEGNLKKWTDGQVTDAYGQWITTTAYTLPGESGSPILNDQGQVVGLLHRGPSSEDLFSRTGVDMYSTGTASAPIVAALTAVPSPPLVSTVAATTADEFLAHDRVFLNARTRAVNIGGVSTDAISILGVACDKGLAQTDFMSTDDLAGALTPCYHAQTWIDCRSDAAPVPYGVLCPVPTELAAWSNRYQQANQLGLGMNGQPDYYSMTFGIARLQSLQAVGVSAGAQSLQQILDTVSPFLDFRVAYYLAAFSIASYGGTQIADYINNYRQVPHYELQATSIAYAASWLAGYGIITKPQLQGFLQNLFADPSINTNARLAIEDYLYLMDAL